MSILGILLIAEAVAFPAVIVGFVVHLHRVSRRPSRLPVAPLPPAPKPGWKPVDIASIPPVPGWQTARAELRWDSMPSEIQERPVTAPKVDETERVMTVVRSKVAELTEVTNRLEAELTRAEQERAEAELEEHVAQATEQRTQALAGRKAGAA